MIAGIQAIKSRTGIFELMVLNEDIKKTGS